MSNDLISREALRKAFHERIYYFDKSSWDEANALINNAPTVEYPFYQEAYQTGYEEGKNEKAKESEIVKAYTKGFDTGVETVKNARPQGEFSRKDLESWLYQIAMNNIGTDFEKSVVEIIHRLDGFERFVSEQKGGAE